MVLLIAEQFRADYLDRYAILMGAGGFRKLMEDGAYFPGCRIPASTFTATSLATIATGAYPDTHGIVADNWYDPAGKRVVPAAAAAIEGTTLAEQVLSADTRNRVLASAQDRDRAAFLSGGDGRICSLEGALETDPLWLRDFRQAYAPEKKKNAAWQALRVKEDVPPLRTLRDDPAKPGEFLRLYRSSPFAQQAQMELARVLLSSEKSEGLLFVPVVVSAPALLGYETGADSPLMRDLILQLDQQIEITLGMLNREPGAGHYTLAFTAAHGAPAEPPEPRRAQMAISGEAVARTIDQALSARYDVSSVKNRYIERYVYPFVYLRHEQLRRYGIDPREARRAAGEAALRLPGVAAFYTADGECSRGGEWRERFRNSFHALRSGDLMLAYHAGCVEDTGAGRGVSYGSLYSYDARVPLLLLGPQFASRTFDEPVELADVAPTLARAMGVAPPSSSVGKVLAEAFVKRGEK